LEIGMGIDISDIRKKVLWGKPQSMFDLWQEVGRVGRDNSKVAVLGYVFPT
jgi:superfamily II DNA helicase RecQ